MSVAPVVMSARGFDAPDRFAPMNTQAMHAIRTTAKNGRTKGVWLCIGHPSESIDLRANPVAITLAIAKAINRLTLPMARTILMLSTLLPRERWYADCEMPATLGRFTSLETAHDVFIDTVFEFSKLK